MKARRAALVFILITVTLDMVAVGIIIPVLPTLILYFLGGGATRAATWLGIFATVFALMQFLFAPVLGVVSDRVGRRPVILLSNLGLGLDYFVMALAPTIGWLFLGRIISGVTRGQRHHRHGLHCRYCSSAKTSPALSVSSGPPSGWALSSDQRLVDC